ncbi:hypothetical protein TNCV_2739991 [Trichonephila clavipes]|nr:hypothetical protein TNCV_2739991 [Trichonephila clavipes]
MAPRELSELTVLSRRKSHLLGQITRIKNSLDNVDSPLNEVGLKKKLASLSEVKAKIEVLRNESYSVLSDEELPNFEDSLERGCQLKCRPRHLTMVQNYVVRRQKPSCS